MIDEQAVLGTTPKAIAFLATKGIPLLLQAIAHWGVRPSVSCSRSLTDAIGISFLLRGDVLGLMCDAYSSSPRGLNSSSSQC